MNLDQALRDAAEPVPARVEQAPAQALLDRIVRTPMDSAPAPAVTRLPRRAAVTVFAAVAAVAVALTVTLSNVGAGPAYASWTPDPSPLPAADRADLADRCVEQVGGTLPPAAGRRVVGELRGHYAYANVVTPTWTATCFRDRGGKVLYGGNMMAPVSRAALGGRGVEMQAWGQLRTDEGYCRLMAGHVGSEVVGVDLTVRNAAGGPARIVRTTMADGYFLAWYPERAAEANTNRTFLTLRLADGGTVDGLSARDLHDAPVLD
ncbi:hypothetical protein [Jidongwangia harbinensis]|uniref:hypothetical protein n=1 Tax=Jidongwangia harbinensis TaxID=2878561 RepID=UPI001CD99CAF|nr:hypothetical protein [Jidongwangia harbinensis]MCA2215737.1 hypothetical protein [Jidongwangia harbinensis]